MNNKKFLPVIHVVNETKTFDNIAIALEAKADGVFLISHGYFKHKDLIELGAKIKHKYPFLWIGFNFLEIPIITLFSFFETNGEKLNSICDAIWFDDSKRGVDKIKADEITLAWKNSKFKGLLFGGVAFKYCKQPSDIQQATKDSIGNMNIVTTTGTGTGRSPSMQKIKIMSEALSGNEYTPLAIASGVDKSNIKDYLPYVDYYLVATGISIDHSTLDREKTIELGKLIKTSKN